MSSEGENGKNPPVEGDDAKAEEVNDKPPAEPKEEDGKTEEKDEKESEDVKDSKEPAEKKEEKEEKKEVKEDKEEDDASEETAESEKDEKEDEGEDDDKNSVKDKKKKNASDDKEKEKEKDNKDGKIEIPEGAGTQLGEIPRIDASISRFKNDDLKLLHRLLFKKEGKTMMIKKNIRKFNGFDFKKDSEEYNKKLAAIEKFEVKQLRIVCEMLDLEKKGNKDEMSERILGFLIEPKDSGKGAGGGRPKRMSAVRANNRGYSSHDESYSSDEKPRSRRTGKRTNYKDDTSSESDEDFQPSDASEEEKVTKRKRGGRGKKKDDSEEEASELESNSSEESDDGPKSKKKKIVNSKVKGKASGRGRGRKPAAATPAKKKTPAKRGRKKAQESSEEEEEEESENAREEEGSSSEDEPLAKKTVKNPQPPTDEEIKTYVKEILEGANLEEITMKTVCKQVYAHYPDFDLTHKKDYIKTTVKSLIST